MYIASYTTDIACASAIAKVLPLDEIITNVFYCYVLGIVALLYILFKKNLDQSVKLAYVFFDDILTK